MQALRVIATAKPKELFFVRDGYRDTYKNDNFTN